MQWNGCLTPQFTPGVGMFLYVNGVVFSSVCLSVCLSVRHNVIMLLQSKTEYLRWCEQEPRQKGRQPCGGSCLVVVTKLVSSQVHYVSHIQPAPLKSRLRFWYKLQEPRDWIVPRSSWYHLWGHTQTAGSYLNTPHLPPRPVIGYKYFWTCKYFHFIHQELPFLYWFQRMIKTWPASSH